MLQIHQASPVNRGNWNNINHLRALYKALEIIPTCTSISSQSDSLGLFINRGGVELVLNEEEKKVIEQRFFYSGSKRPSLRAINEINYERIRQVEKCALRKISLGFMIWEIEGIDINDDCFPYLKKIETCSKDQNQNQFIIKV